MKIDVYLGFSMDNTGWKYMIKNLKDYLIQSFSYIEQKWTCSGFTIRQCEFITLHLHYITCIYTYICIVLKFWQGTSLRSYTIRMKNQGHFYSIIEFIQESSWTWRLFPKEVTFKNLLNLTSRAWIKPGILFFLKSNSLKWV